MPVLITTVHTQLSLDEARNRIASIVEPKSVWQAWLYPQRAGAGGACFVGLLEGTSFKVTRIIAYKNSFLPVITGRFVQGNLGADVRLIMTLHPLVALFMLCWFGGLGAGAVSTFESVGWSVAVLPFGLCLFGLAVTVGGFMPEALRAKRLIREKLGAA